MPAAPEFRTLTHISYEKEDARAGPVAQDGPKYVVERLLGEGAEGRVYLAFDTDLRRRVAMKVIQPRAAASAPHLERFLAEARRTASLQHSGIPAVYDVGYTADGELFFTMRAVDGLTLVDVLTALREGDAATAREWTLTRRVLALQQVAQAIHYAHLRGLVHRDLKPSNVAVGSCGEVLVLDWGLSKRVAPDPDSADADAAPEFVPTQLGTIKGTLLYMAPEQALGDIHRIDARSDVFSLGAILYEMLCLLPPYRGTSKREILMAARTGTIEPPEERGGATDLPPMLVRTAMKALSMPRARRQRSAQEFAADLQRFLEAARSA